MSLTANPTTGIIIQNSNNSEKFNSNNKLVYRKAYQTGSLSYTSAAGQITDIPVNANFNAEKDFGIVYIKPTTANGNISSQLVNSWVQLGFSLLTHVTYATSRSDVTSWDLLSAALLGSGTATVLRFDYSPLDSLFFTGGTYTGGTINSSMVFNWKLIILSYR